MIVVVGLSHRTAPIEVRERLALGREAAPTFLRALQTDSAVGEALLVSTCNRVELVAVPASPATLEDCASACIRAFEVQAPQIGRHLVPRVGALAVHHLFRVASSLDSMVLGEPQILGQLKEAYEVARMSGTLGPVLHRTIPRALRTAKRVRSETAIGSGQVSVPTVAVDLTRQIFGDLRRTTALLIGSGEMAEAVAHLLRAAGARLIVLGRTVGRVENLARLVGGEPRTWHELKTTLVEADVVITSTSAPGYVLTAETLSTARRARRGAEQSLIDLAVPRDIDPKVNELEGVFLYNIDDFSRLVAEALSLRSKEAELAEAIVEQETRGYERWAEAEQATPAIVELRSRIRRVLSQELERSLRGGLKHLGPEERACLFRMMEAAENRMLHGPTMRLRQAAAERAGQGLSLEELAAVLSDLFELDQASYEIVEREALSTDAPPPDSASFGIVRQWQKDR